MKILFISDVESKYLWDYFDKKYFEDIELIISCGDLKAEYLSFLVTMASVPLLYVHGNHDSDYIKNPPEGCDCIEDTIVTYNNIRILGLGGSKLYNNGDFQYSEEEMKKRIKKLKRKIIKNDGFDILVTHAGLYGFDDDKDLCHGGFLSFNELLDKYSPKYFVHGHIHLNYGRKERIREYNKTTVINAYEKYILDYDVK